MKKNIASRRMVLALLLTIIIFFGGVLLGNYLTAKKLLSVDEMSNSLRLNTLGVEVEYEILKENICENDNVLYLTDELFLLSERLTYMENLLGADHEKVINLKKYYFILEGKHFLLAKKQKECHSDGNSLDNSILLYFYSNNGDCDFCDEQSSVLTYLLSEHPGLKIYSFDNNLDSPVVNVFKKLYGVGESAPVLVINEKTYYGFMDKNTLVEEMEG